MRSVRPAEDFLAAEAELAPSRDFFFGGRGPLPDQGARIPLGLEQAGHELDLVGPDDCRRRL